MKDDDRGTRTYTCAVCGKQFTTHPYFAGIQRRGEAWVGIPTCSKDCQRAQLTKSDKGANDADAD